MTAPVVALRAVDAARGLRDTDLGNSERLVMECGQTIRFCYEQRRWYVWDGRRWKGDNDGQIMRLTDDVVRGLYAEASRLEDSEDRQRAAKHAKASENLKRREAMVTGAQHLVPVHLADLDAHQYLLNVANGVLNLRTGELGRHDPALLFTHLVDVPYYPDADAPIWLNFLDRVLAGDADLIAYLRRAIGYTLTGDVSEHRMFVAYGSGRNGKGTVLHVLQLLLAGLAKAADRAILLATNRDAGAATPGLAALVGVRAAVVDEVNEGNRLDSANVKWITGGSIVTARPPYGQLFEYDPQFKVWLAVNHRPDISDTSEGMWSRLHLVPFRVTIPEAERDTTLKDRLTAEAPGILAWAVQGCLEWQRYGLQPPDVVVAATAEYRADQDQVGAYLAMKCEFGPDKRTSAQGLYVEYERWARAEGQDVISQRAFNSRVRDHGHRSAKSHGVTTWVGLMPTSTYGDQA